MSRIPKYTRGKVYEFYKQMRELDLMYHPDDRPEDICHPDCIAPGEPFKCLFTPEECTQLNVIAELIWADTNGDPCEVAYQVAVDCGDILEN